MSDEQKHETIWLQPWCDGCEKNAHGSRQWCEDDVWGKCDECEQTSVKYALPPPQVDSGREEIARIIDPDAFEDAMLQDDLTPSERFYFSANRETEKLNALAKADAIIALSHNGTRKET